MVRQTIKPTKSEKTMPTPTKSGVGKAGNALPEPRPTNKVGLPAPKPATKLA